MKQTKMIERLETDYINKCRSRSIVIYNDTGEVAPKDHLDVSYNDREVVSYEFRFKRTNSKMPASYSIRKSYYSRGDDDKVSYIRETERDYNYDAKEAASLYRDLVADFKCGMIETYRSGVSVDCVISEAGSVLENTDHLNVLIRG